MSIISESRERTHRCSQFCFFPFFYRFKVFQNKEKYEPPGWGWGGRVNFWTRPWPVLPCQVSAVPSIFWMFPMFLMKDNKRSKIQDNVFYNTLWRVMMRHRTQKYFPHHANVKHSTLNCQRWGDRLFRGRESTRSALYSKPLDYLDRYHHHLDVTSLTFRIKIHTARLPGELVTFHAVILNCAQPRLSYLSCQILSSSRERTPP